MATGYAAGIAGWTGAATIAGCNLVGSLLSGWLFDRISHRKILIVLPLFGATALLGIFIFPEQMPLFLGGVGLAYGGTMATYRGYFLERTADMLMANRQAGHTAIYPFFVTAAAIS